MSKVTIAGDVNGTGVFTIAAPNGNTNRTLTLPDEAGTILVNGTSEIVTKPNQPSFLAVVLNNVTGNGTVGGTEGIIFGDERHDTNGDYNASTGVFTAPVTGSYLISYNLTPSSSSISARYFRGQLFLNNSVYLNPHNSVSDELANGDYNNVGGSAVILLNAGDVLDVRFGSSIATNNYTFYNNMNWFSGYFLG